MLGLLLAEGVSDSEVGVKHRLTGFADSLAEILQRRVQFVGCIVPLRLYLLVLPRGRAAPRAAQPDERASALFEQARHCPRVAVDLSGARLDRGKIPKLFHDFSDFCLTVVVIT